MVSVVKTIYSYEENFTNLGVVIILIIAIVLLAIGIIIFIPLLKQCFLFAKVAFNDTIKTQFIELKRADIIKIVLTTVIIYSILTVGMIFSIILLRETEFRWVDTNISTCSISSGTIKDFDCKKVEYRDVVWYDCSFSIACQEFKIDPSESQSQVLEYLYDGAECTIYYRDYGEKTVVVEIRVAETRV